MLILFVKMEISDAKKRESNFYNTFERTKLWHTQIFISFNFKPALIEDYAFLWHSFLREFAFA